MNDIIRDNTPRALAGEQIRRLIATGGFRRGDQLPTNEDLCGRLGVSLLTVQRAMGAQGIELLARRCRRARPSKPVVCRVPVDFRPVTSTAAPPPAA